MPPLVDRIRNLMNSPRGGSPICLICGRRVARHHERMDPRGSAVVHRACATYDVRRRRAG